MWRAIYIMWLRQMKRYVRSRARIVASLAQPLLFLVTFGFGFSAIFQQAGAGNYIQFLAPGIIAMGIVFSSVFSGIEVMWDRQFGFLKETLVAPVPRIGADDRAHARRRHGRADPGPPGADHHAGSSASVRRRGRCSSRRRSCVMALVSVMFTAFGTAVGASSATCRASS